MFKIWYRFPSGNWDGGSACTYATYADAERAISEELEDGFSDDLSGDGERAAYLAERARYEIRPA